MAFPRVEITTAASKERGVGGLENINYKTNSNNMKTNRTEQTTLLGHDVQGCDDPTYRDSTPLDIAVTATAIVSSKR